MRGAGILLLFLMLAAKGKGGSSSSSSGGGSSGGEVLEEYGRINGYPFVIEHMAGGGYAIEMVTGVVDGVGVLESQQVTGPEPQSQLYSVAKHAVELILGELPAGVGIPWPDHWTDESEL